MTVKEFQELNCKMCGTQYCPGDEEAISTCGYYEDNIPGIIKRQSLLELLKNFKVSDAQMTKTAKRYGKLPTIEPLTDEELRRVFYDK